MPVHFDDADRRECLFLHSEGLGSQAIVSVMNTGRKRCVLWSYVAEPMQNAPSQATEATSEHTGR